MLRSEARLAAVEQEILSRLAPERAADFVARPA